MSYEGAAHWERTYAEEGKRWGDEPSELARLAVALLRSWSTDSDDGAAAGRLRVLDVGCGYGRDAVHLARELGAAVVGIDPATRAVEMARDVAPSNLTLDYRRGVIDDVRDGAYDAVFCANTYHVLRPPERRALARRSAELLRPGGLFFLSTLAVGDPQHYGRGESVPGDEESWQEGARYLHFSSEGSLRREFGELTVERLEPHAFHEPHAGGSTHDHVHWLMVARRKK